MKNNCLPTRIFAATLILYAALGGPSAFAGEPWTPLKAPTLYYACYMQGGKTFYASAVGAVPNPGATIHAQGALQIEVQKAYAAWLEEHYGTSGVINCSPSESRAATTKWIADSKLLFSTVQWVDTGWKYSGGSSSPGSSTANAAAATASPNPASSQSAYVANMPGPYWACAASANGVQHDSAIFPQPNIFPQQITWEYRNYLNTKYHIGSMPNCESRPTRAEAEAFLAKHAAGTIPGANSVSTQRIATGWIPHQLGGPPIEDVVAPPPPPAPKPHGPTAFYACKSNKESERTEYTSAAFLADAGQAAAIGKAFDKYLIGMFGHEGVIECPQFATLAKANDWINQRRMFAIRNHSSIETTKWKPEGAYDETNASAASSATAGASAVAPAPTPKPVTPPPPKPVVAAVVPSKPPAAAKGIFVTCNSNSFQDRARYYNPPIQVTSGDYASWMASYEKFLQTTFKYSAGVMCNNQPTLAAAQSYFKEITDTARLTTKDNLDRPWPVVLTNWKYP